MQKDVYIVSPEKDGYRLDVFLAEELGDTSSRSQIQHWIKKEFIQSPQHEKVKASLVVSEGDSFTVTPIREERNEKPVEMDIPVVFEDNILAVIRKPPGIAVHPGPGQRETTLVHGLLHRFGSLPNESEDFRPGLVHRLDKDTEGLMVIAKTPKSLRSLSKAFQERSVVKEYSAWLLSSPKEEEFRIELPLKRSRVDRQKMAVDHKGRMAITNVKVIKNLVSKHRRKYTYVDIKIETGRTHQIRAHMAHIGCPVVGDVLYSRNAKDYEKYGLLLLARKLAFVHPETKKTLEFEIGVPLRFLKFEKNAINM